MAADEKIEDIADRLDLSLNSVQSLLNEVLDLSRIDAGIVDTHIVDFRLDDVFAELETEFAALAEDKGLTLKVVRTTWMVRSDRQLLRRIIQNLLSNAVRYTQHGRILLCARRRGDMVRIEIRDTGPGIAVEEQARVFQEFKRLDGAGNAEQQGLGLGLAIVERISRILNHKVTVRSAIGKGSTFAVDTPYVAAARSPVHNDRRIVSTRELSGAHIVCIDNDENVLTAMQALLESWSCSTSCARSEEELLSAPARERLAPDVIVADYHLDAGVTGVDAIRNLRSVLGRRIPGVIVSADQTLEVRARVRSSGLYFLAKPLAEDELRTRLKSLVRNQRGPDLLH